MNRFLVLGCRCALALGFLALAARGRGSRPRTLVPWLPRLRAAVVDLTELERLRASGEFATPAALLDYLQRVSGGGINGIVFYTWPGHVFPEERWDEASAAKPGAFDVPGFVALCHARGLKVVAAFNGRHFAVARTGAPRFDPWVDARGRTHSPQGREFTGIYDQPAASFFGAAFEQSVDRFCVDSVRAGFDALYLIEYNLPTDDRSPSALTYFQTRTGLKLDSWEVVRRDHLAQWQETRDARLLEFIAGARDAANRVRPVPFGVLTAFALVGHAPHLWQSDPLMLRVLPTIDFAGIYCRAAHWKLTGDVAAQEAALLARLDPSIPILGELYVGSQAEGPVPTGEVRREAEGMAARDIGWYLWLVGLGARRFSYATLPAADWQAMRTPSRIPTIPP
jgi:hypothetical protein